LRKNSFLEESLKGEKKKILFWYSFSF
jgi:hypothetical protein